MLSLVFNKLYLKGKYKTLQQLIEIHNEVDANNFVKALSKFVYHNGDTLNETNFSGYL